MPERDSAGSTARWFRFVSSWTHTVPFGVGPCHHHPYHEIVYHRRGRGTIATTDGRSVDFAPGCVTLHLPGSVHTQTMSEPGEDCCLLVEYTGPLARGAEPLQVFPRVDADREERIKVLSGVPLRSSPAQQAIFDHRAAALLLELVDEGSRITSLSTEPGIYQAQQAWALIRSEFRTIRSLDGLASRIGVSYDYLRHCFRRLYGVSLKAHLIATRLERAKDLLRHSHLPLKAVSDLCGFSSERHLCERFKADVGISPGAFRHQR